MKTKTNLKKTLAAICVLALLIGVLPAAALAENLEVDRREMVAGEVTQDQATEPTQEEPEEGPDVEVTKEEDSGVEAQDQTAESAQKEPEKEPQKEDSNKAVQRPSAVPAQITTEETKKIPESDKLFVNGDVKVIKVEGDMSVILRLVVEEPESIHILTSGVDITLALYDEATFKLCGVYLSEDGFLDVPYDAEKGTYLLGFSGKGEIAVMVADEELTAKLYEYLEAEEGSSEDLIEEFIEAPAEELTEEPVEELVEELSKEPEEASGEEPVDTYDPSAPIHYEFTDGSTVSVLSILKGAGANVNMIKAFTRDTAGWFSDYSNTDGDWLLLPYAYFDSIEASVRAGFFDASDGSITDEVYTLILSYPDPAAKPVEEVSEVPAEDLPEELTEEPTEEPVEELTEEPTEEPEEEPVEEPVGTYDPSVPIRYEFTDSSTVSVLSILKGAGANVNMIKAFTRDTAGWFSDYSNTDGDWLLLPYAYFDSIEASVRAGYFDASDGSITDEVYTLILSYPDPAAKPAEDLSEELTGEPTEEPSEEPTEEPEEEPVYYDPSVPVRYEFADGSKVSVLSILKEVGAHVNMIKAFTRDSDGWFSDYSSTDGDWLLLPYAYFDSIEASVKAGYFDASDGSITDDVYTLILSYPDPAAKGAESAEDQIPVEEVTIAVERREDNEIRLFAENMSPDDDENYVYQWQYSLDGENWLDVDGANDRDYTFKLDKTNGQYYWRLIVSGK